MMKKLLFTIICLIPTLAFAQFNIDNRVEAQNKSIEQIQTLEKEDSPFVVLNDAYLKNQKKLIRQERNTFSIENSLYFTQYGYKNWSSGGDNSFNGRITTYIKHMYSISDRFDVTSIFDAAYALGLQDSVIAKTEDKFNFNVALNYQMSDHFFYALSVDGKTQFANAYTTNSDTGEEVINSGIFAPATITVGLGITYKLDANRTITISPVSGNMITMFNQTLSDAGSNGVTPGKKVKLNFGMAANSSWKQPIIKDTKGVNGGTDILSYRLSLSSFWDYETVPNLYLQNWLDLSVYKYFSISFNASLVFDDKVTPTEGDRFWQFNEVLGVGVKYTFSR